MPTNNLNDKGGISLCPHNLPEGKWCSICLSGPTPNDKKSNWEERFKDINYIVAFCPDCLTYGTPFGLRDNQCGNCSRNNLRHYVESDTVKSFIAQIEQEARLDERQTIATQIREKLMRPNIKDNCQYATDRFEEFISNLK